MLSVPERSNEDAVVVGSSVDRVLGVASAACAARLIPAKKVPAVTAITLRRLVISSSLSDVVAAIFVDEDGTDDDNDETANASVKVGDSSIVAVVVRRSGDNDGSFIVVSSIVIRLCRSLS